MDIDLLSKIDLIVMDEMYKIRNEDNQLNNDFLNNRSMRFRKVAELIGMSKNKVVYLSPFTYCDTASMKAFLDKYSIYKINRKIEYVKKVILDGSEYTNANNNFKRTAELMEMLKNEKNIVYVSSRDEATKIIDIYKNEIVFSERLRHFYNHIKDNYDIEEYEWDITKALKKGVGIYISSMPRYVKREIVNLYEQNELMTIIATTSFTEGVNCNAKNLILNSRYTGKSIKLKQIDMLNIIGRVGRFSKESVGKVYCVNSDILKTVIEYTKNEECLLENDNYRESHKKRSDFELDMIDYQYLNSSEIKRIDIITAEQREMGLSDSELNISLSVSKKWKLVLFKYFKEFVTLEDIVLRKELINTLLNNSDEKKQIEAITFIFGDIKNAFENAGILAKEAFPTRPGGISAFDKNGSFVWGRLYKNYILGDVKGSIKKNIKYVLAIYNLVKENQSFTSKKDAKLFFDEKGYKWILDYFDKDLKLKHSKFYNDYFEFVANIMQYKMPFYLNFYLSIFNLYLKKENHSDFVIEGDKEKDLQILFEEGALSLEYKSLSDFGIPMITLNKLKQLNISCNELFDRYANISELDSYEKIMLADYYKIMGST